MVYCAFFVTCTTRCCSLGSNVCNTVLLTGDVAGSWKELYSEYPTGFQPIACARLFCKVSDHLMWLLRHMYEGSVWTGGSRSFPISAGVRGKCVHLALVGSFLFYSKQWLSGGFFGAIAVSIWATA